MGSLIMQDLKAQYQKMLAKREDAHAKLREVNPLIEDAERALLQQVEMTRNASSVTLRYGGRTINVKRRRGGTQYLLKERGHSFPGEYSSSIRQLRLDIALGKI